MAVQVPEMPSEIPRRGNALTEWIGRSVLGLLGWRIEGEIPAEPKLVIIVAPHTSAWDFVIGLAAKFVMRLDSSYLAKDSLFRWPLSILLRRTGGIPVDRSGTQNLVERMAERFAERDRLVLTLAPEGTRRHVGTWKTGFYRIAERAGVPILPIAFDFNSRALRIGPPLTPTGDLQAETDLLRNFFDPVMGRRIDAAAPSAES